MIDLTIKVHQHYVTSCVRLWHNSDAYEEYCVCEHTFPLHLLTGIIPSGRHAVRATCLAYMERHSDFPTFPYPAYLEVCIRFDESGGYAVQGAKYVEAQRGIVDFTNAFTIGNAEIRSKVLRRMVGLIAERNAEELNKMILTLRAASGGAFKKIS